MLEYAVMGRFIIKFLLFTVLVVVVGLYRLNELNKIPVKIENYSTVNLVEIYALGLAMSALAYPIYPEIAVEHLSLYKKQKVDREDDFFMQSEVVRQAIENYKRPTMLVWDANDYMFGNSEARVALAFNGAVLSKSGKTISIDVPIRYPRNSLVTLLPGLQVQEGLFWVLQEKGWYYPGTMTWTHTLN
jgi:hypothetical protein